MQEEWEVIREIEFNQLARLRTSEIPEAEDLYECGSVETYDTTYDRITSKSMRPMKKSAADRNFNTSASSTTDDSVIRDLRHQGQGDFFWLIYYYYLLLYYINYFILIYDKLI